MIGLGSGIPRIQLFCVVVSGSKTSRWPRQQIIGLLRVDVIFVLIVAVLPGEIVWSESCILFASPDPRLATGSQVFWSKKCNPNHHGQEKVFQIIWGRKQCSIPRSCYFFCWMSIFIQDGASSCTKDALMVKTKRHSKVILDFWLLEGGYKSHNNPSWTSNWRHIEYSQPNDFVHLTVVKDSVQHRYGVRTGNTS